MKKRITKFPSPSGDIVCLTDISICCYRICGSSFRTLVGILFV